MFTEFSVGFWLYTAGFAGLVLYALIGLICEITAASKKEASPEVTSGNDQLSASIK